MKPGAPALAVALHDPEGRLADPIRTHAEALSKIFSTVAVNVSTATNQSVLSALGEIRSTRLSRHEPDERLIGRFRRDAVALVLDHPSIFYTDIDHLLRWLEIEPSSLRATLVCKPDADMLIVGRSPRAFAAEPQRLQQTERLVNQLHALLTGQECDLMFAMRRMTGAVARMIVEQSPVDSLANDVDWPLRARECGFTVDYADCDALFYRTLEDYGQPEDTGDSDPLQWIRRLEFAALQASAMRRYLAAAREP